MRLWHLVFAVFVAALCLAMGRDPIGRVALVVFVAAVGMVASGTSTLLMLFRTIGAIGAARTGPDYVEAVGATAGVLVLGTALMLAVFHVGAGLVIWAVN